ncbi:MAG: enoyl-CoA hydratase [Acidimicrobiia bacterium]|nr:enoyl-CoA hydratase [Acidimicrobiia bacterium]
MPINTDAVGSVSEPRERSWDHKDCLLYSLGVGAGAADPTGAELDLTTENSEGVTQRVLPTMAVVLQAGGLDFSKLGKFDLSKMLHGEQGITLHRGIPTEGRLRTTNRIAAIYDKGAAAVVVMEGDTVLVDTGEPLFSTRSSLFLRGEGGWGGERGPSGPSNAAPDRAPDHSVTYQTRSDQALLYRLNGDRNPLHSDPTFAARGGFPKPILHGLCTYGVTGRALLHALCGSDPARFKAMDARFTSPVMPGEPLTVDMWETGGGEALFRTSATDGRVVLDSGRLAYTS